MFYNVTLPVTLWFLDRGKKHVPYGTEGSRSGKTDRKNKILFIDARNIYRQIDRAHRDWTDEHIEQIASIVRSYRSKNGKKYKDVKGLCKVATIDEVKKAGYSLNPGCYVGVTDNGDKDDENLKKIEL
ncbi:MAG TPA: N-6 DNA methylase [Patescibacteria group bacterium]